MRAIACGCIIPASSCVIPASLCYGQGVGPNLALRNARLDGRLSQEDLARRIREAGYRDGDPNGCTRGMVQRWESGQVRRPQGRYLIALENVLGAPAAHLGFADAAAGTARSGSLADAGLDSPMPLPQPVRPSLPLGGLRLLGGV